MVDEQGQDVLMVPAEMGQPIRDDQARVNITWKGQNGDLPDPVHVDSTDGDVRQMVTEAVRGGIPGIDADGTADFTNFVVDRFGPKDEVTYNRMMIRPKTEFGIEITDMTDGELKNEFGDLSENAKRMTSNEKEAFTTLCKDGYSRDLVFEIVTRFIRS